MRVRLLRRIKELEQIIEEKNMEIERLKLLVGTRIVEIPEEEETNPAFQSAAAVYREDAEKGEYEP